MDKISNPSGNGVFTHIMERPEKVLNPIPKTYEVAYHVIVSGFTDELQTRVNSLLGKGWQPIGGLAICQAAGGGYQYGQAMVKY